MLLKSMFESFKETKDLKVCLELQIVALMHKSTFGMDSLVKEVEDYINKFIIELLDSDVISLDYYISMLKSRDTLFSTFIEFPPSDERLKESVRVLAEESYQMINDTALFSKRFVESEDNINLADRLIDKINKIKGM